MISTLLKQLMSACKLQQKDLAEVLEVPIDRVKSLTSGRVKNFTRKESELLIGKLDIRADWLISGEGPMFQDDEETQDEFIDRQQAIKRMSALINAMPLREITRKRLCAVMKGDAAEDGSVLAEAIRREALGIDFVTGKPIDGVAPQTALPPRQRALLDNYEHADESGKKIIEGTASLAAQQDKCKKA